MSPKCDDLISWLDEELSQRGWNLRWLSERSGIPLEALKRARVGDALGWEACMEIARALDVPPELVLGKGGWLPQASEGEIGFESWRYVLALLSSDERYELFQMAIIKLDILQGGIRLPV